MQVARVNRTVQKAATAGRSFAAVGRGISSTKTSGRAEVCVIVVIIAGVVGDVLEAAKVVVVVFVVVVVVVVVVLLLLLPVSYTHLTLPTRR